MITEEEAIKRVLEILNDHPVQNEDEAALMDNITIDKPDYWIFFYNSRAYVENHNESARWLGPGPIFVKKKDGSICRYSSGEDLENIIYDYECELEADEKIWCLVIDGHQDSKKTILIALKQILGLNQRDISAIIGRVPGKFFTGKRRDLDWVGEQLRAANIPYSIELINQDKIDTAEPFALPKWWVSGTLADAYHAQHPTS